MNAAPLFEIIHEDRDLLVINKPAGLVCHPTKTDEYSSLIGRVRLYLGFPAVRSAPVPGVPGAASSDGKPAPNSPSAPFDSGPRLVNRLDRETSGVVIIAKNRETAGQLGKLLEERAVEKEYLALVHGQVRDEHGIIDAPLGKDERSQIAIRDCVRPDGAPARTRQLIAAPGASTR